MQEEKDLCYYPNRISDPFPGAGDLGGCRSAVVTDILIIFFCLDMIKSKWLLNIMVMGKALAFSEKILESLKHLKDRSEMEE